jgi:hypothetical protein
MCKVSPRYLGAVLGLLLAPLACTEKSPTEPQPPCSFTLSATSLSLGAGATSASVTVETAARCSWEALSDRGWMTVNGAAARTGAGTVSVTLTENTSESTRTGTLTIAGQAVAVRQDGAVPPCTFDLDPTSSSWSHDGGARSFAVVTAQHCGWTARSNVPWVTITSGQQGSGSGTVTYGVERNRETVARTGTITAAERTFTISQAGDTPAVDCAYSVAPIEFNVCMAVPYTLTASVTTQQGCSWTAVPEASWITVAQQSGTGPGTVSFTVGENWAAPRGANVMVRWPTPTAGQNLHVAQAGCRYAVSSSAISIAASGGPGHFDVFQQSDPLECGGPLQNGCRWSAEADVPWITITTSMPQAGDNPVAFTVAANGGAQARTGTIKVRDKVVVVTQSGS